MNNMLHIKKQDLLIDTFDNISELDKFLKDPKNYKPGRENSSQSGNQWFTGTDNYEQAEELLKYGDVETFKFIKEKQRELKIDKIIGNVINKPKTFNNIVGYQPNVPLYLNRVPTNMIDSKKIKTDFKIINIYLDVCASARVEADEIRNAGTIYATVLDMLEKSGYRTNLYIGDVSELGNEKVMYALKIKTDREPLNLEKMAFPIAHPSMLRRIGFKYMEVCDSNQDFTYSGYGRPYTDENKIKDWFKKYLKMDVLVFSYQNGLTFTIEDTINRLKDKGIKIGDDE